MGFFVYCNMLKSGMWISKYIYLPIQLPIIYIYCTFFNKYLFIYLLETLSTLVEDMIEFLHLERLRLW